MRTPGYTRCTCGACFTFTYIYLSISVSDFDLTFRPLVVIFDFYSAKVSQAGNTANTGTSPIDGKTFHDPPKSKIAVS